MNKLKDFLYNISDILLSIIILGIIIVSFWYVVGGFFVDNLPYNMGSYINLPVSSMAKDMKSFERAEIEEKNAVLDEKTSDDIDIPVISDMNLDEIPSETDDENAATTVKNDESRAEKTPISEEIVDKKLNEISKEPPKTPEKSQTSQENPSQISSNTKVNITISAGDTSEDVAKILYENGVVKDKNSFLSYLINNKLDTKLPSGKFTMEKNMSDEDAAKVFFN